MNRILPSFFSFCHLAHFGAEVVCICGPYI